MRGLPFFFVKERRFLFERAPFLFREERELFLIWSVSPRHGRSKDFSVPSPLLRRRESFVISDKNEHETGRRKRTAVGGNKLTKIKATPSVSPSAYAPNGEAAPSGKEPRE